MAALSNPTVLVPHTLVGGTQIQFHKESLEGLRVWRLTGREDTSLLPSFQFYAYSLSLSPSSTALSPPKRESSSPLLCSDARLARPLTVI